jgi:hypothetical protein
LSGSDVKTRLDIKSMHDQLEALRDPTITRWLANGLDFVNWYKGEDVIVSLGSLATVPASTRRQLGLIGPPAEEQWDLISIFLVDGAAVDVNDSAAIMINSNDELPSGLNNQLPVQGYQTATAIVFSDATSRNWWIWPNWQSSLSNLDMIGMLPLRRTSQNSGRAIAVVISTTATVGNRTPQVYALARRRPV